MPKVNLNDTLTGERIFWENWGVCDKSFFNSCLALTKSQYQDAENLHAEVMNKAYTVICREKRQVDNFYAWLMRMAKNNYFTKCSCVDYLVFLEEIAASHFSSLSNPKQSLMQKEFYEYIEQIFKKLPLKHAYLSRLYFDGYSYADISKSCEVKQDTLRQIVRTCRQQLCIELKPCKKGDVCKPISSEQAEYGHLCRVNCSGEIHYHYFINSTAPYRLEQKEEHLKKYLFKHPKSTSRRLALVNNQVAQGKVKQALQGINDLTENDYCQEEVYDVKIQVLSCLKSFSKVQETASLATENFSKSKVKFKTWQLIAENREQEAETYLKEEIQQEPQNLQCRELLVIVYERLAKFEALYEECEFFYRQESYPLVLLPIMVRAHLMFSDFDKVEALVRTYLQRNPACILAQIYRLHLSVGKGDILAVSELKRDFDRLRKSYSWHPDQALLKALSSPKDKRDKILLRRCKDSASCALSTHYLSSFGRSEVALLTLNFEERRHLEIVKIIHKKELNYVSR